MPLRAGPVCRRARSVAMATALGAALAPTPVPAADDRLKLQGDVRLRLESDWDSMQSDGTRRDDRDRMRGRVRLGFTYKVDGVVSFGARLRSGSRESQQSPHVSFGDDFQPKQLNLDKLSIRIDTGGFWGWGGKDAFPFWKPNELFWDDDVTPEGLAAGTAVGLGGTAKLKLAGGMFLLDESGLANGYFDKARLLAGQAALSAEASGVAITAAAGYYDFKDNPDAVNPALRDLDHGILVASLSAQVQGLSRPLVVTADYFENLRDYPATLFNADQTTGYVVSASLGSLKKKADWQLAYAFAHVEEYAVVAFFAQDDWLRWGSATQTRSSNFHGHEIRAAYAFGPQVHLMARYYAVQGIELRSATATAKEDGERFRLDLNVGF